MKKLFTQEEIALLEKNNYTHLVSKSMLKFTDDFKDDFWRLYLTDLPVKEILAHLSQKSLITLINPPLMRKIYMKRKKEEEKY